MDLRTWISFSAVLCFIAPLLLMSILPTTVIVACLAWSTGVLFGTFVGEEEASSHRMLILQFEELQRFAETQTRTSSNWEQLAKRKDRELQDLQRHLLNDSAARALGMQVEQDLADELCAVSDELNLIAQR